MEPLCGVELPLRQRIEALFQRARWLGRAADVPAARACLNQVLSLAPDADTKSRAEKALAELGR
jgi:hypothetical protein